MKTDLKHWFRWLESTPWTETPLYPGRSKKPGSKKWGLVPISVGVSFLLFMVIVISISQKASADNAKIIATLTDDQKYAVVETLKNIIWERSTSPDFSKGAIHAAYDDKVKNAEIANEEQYLLDNYGLDTRGSLSPLQEQAQKEVDKGNSE